MERRPSCWLRRWWSFCELQAGVSRCCGLRCQFHPLGLHIKRATIEYGAFEMCRFHRYLPDFDYGWAVHARRTCTHPATNFLISCRIRASLPLTVTLSHLGLHPHPHLYLHHLVLVLVIARPPAHLACACVFLLYHLCLPRALLRPILSCLVMYEILPSLT